MAIDEGAAFTAAYNNPKNKNIIFHAIRKYRKKYREILDMDSCLSAAQIAVLRCLRSHDDAKGNQFSTSLYRYMEWCLKDEVRKLGKQFNSFAQIPENGFTEPEYLTQSNDFLDEDEIIKGRFQEGQSVISLCARLGLSRRTVQKRINHYIQKERGVK